MANKCVNKVADNYEMIEIKSSTKKKSESSTDVYEDPTTIEHDSMNNATQSSDRSSSESLKLRSLSHIIMILVCAVVILAALGLVFGILYFTKDQNVDQEIQQTPPPSNESVVTNSPLGTFSNPARSCVELRDAGFEDGIYVIQPSLTPFEAYCDMRAAGGGWVLAATINENNFNLTETYGGSWFLTTSNNHQNVLDYQNWMNTNLFGTFDSCTRSDYKSQAYFEYRANDVMLRYVPNQIPLEFSREHSFLQYQTENGFLQNYGGNLYKLFNYHYPLEARYVFYPDVNLMLDRLAARSTEITNLITDFYFYDYGSDTNFLYDYELFGNSYGMGTYYKTTQNCYNDYETYCGSVYVNYGLDYRCDLGNTMVSSRKSHPFFALFAVGNFDHCFDEFNFQTLSYRPDTDLKVVYTGNHTLNNFFLHYDAGCRSGTTYASLCDVWFYVINVEKWKSSGTPIIDLDNRLYTSYYYFGWTISEPASNILFGYTMLSRQNGVLIPETEVKAVTYKILNIISETEQLCPDCFYDDDVLSVPVQFSIGNDSVVDSMLPPSVKPLPTGFIQFRAFGSTGSVYAICPAVRVNDWRSEYVCIGGMKNPNYPYLDDCNDFTNWNGKPNTIIQTTPVRFAHSQRDLDSTIMIFYR